ncbi:MAG: hypothetical protein ACON35_08545 [Candidatus Marinamargulisbacteria bacterium]
MKTKLKPILLIILFTSASLFAQVNIEEYRNSTSGQLVKQKINLQTEIQRSKKSLYAIHIGYLKPLKMDFGLNGFLITKINFGKSNGTEYLNNTFYHLRIFENQPTKNIIPESYIQYEKNKFSSTEERYLAGIGIRYKMNEFFIFGTSILNEWLKETITSSRTSTWRLSQYLQTTIQLNEINRLNVIFYLQPSLNDITNIRYYSESQFISKITNQIAYTSTLTAKFFSQSTVYDDVELYFKSGLSFKI